MNKDKVIEILRGVKYPGFSRDIVSFGMIKDIHLDGENIIVDLHLTTPNEQSKQEIKSRVKEALEQSKSFESVDVRIISSPQPTQTPTDFPKPPGLIPGVKNMIAIASGKGGVGKSTIAVNIAATLAMKEYRVGLLDLDIYGPSLPILLGINERPTITTDRKLVPLEKYGMKVMSFGFISGNDTPVIWRGPMVARMTEQFFQDVTWGELDYLILDLPPGTGDVQLTLVQKLRISGAIIVTTPQDLAVSDVRKGADMFGKVNTSVLGVIENMSGYIVSGIVRDGSGKPLENVTISFSESDRFVDTTSSDDGQFKVELDLFKRGGGLSESSRLNVPLLGEIPISPDLMESCDSGIPMVIKDPDSYVGQIFSQIVNKMIKVVEYDN